MDVFALALLFFAALFLGSILAVGLFALMKVRHDRHDRLQMKRHLQNTRALES